MRPQAMVLLNVPKVSSVQWHPFTVAAVRPLRDATVADVFIKPKGKWAQVRPGCGAWAKL